MISKRVALSERVLFTRTTGSHTHTHTHTYTYAHIHIQTHTQTHTYIHIHIHTHTHTFVVPWPGSTAFELLDTFDSGVVLTSLVLREEPPRAIRVLWSFA